MTAVSSEKNLNCKKYFLFKIQDLINNSFHTFEEKRMESLLQYCNLITDTYEEYHTSIDGDKLKKSYIALLKGFVYQMECHPFIRIEIYCRDFKYISKKIGLNEDIPDKELGNIHRCIVALKKKMESIDIIDVYFKCLDMIEDFQETDYLIEAFISDMLNKGISLAFLNECATKMKEEYFNHKNVDDALKILRQLDKEKEKYSVMIKFTVGSKNQISKALELIEKDFDVINESDLQYKSVWKSQSFYVAKKDIYAMDTVGAIEIAQKEFRAIIDLFDMWQGTRNCIKDDPYYAWVEADELKTIDVTKISNVKMLGYIDDSHRKQMERFLQLRDLLENEEIETLERILYTLNTARSFTVQNRFLNFWSSLEYTLHAFPRNSIIEKARVVVPEAFSLFYIKNKLNIFWKGLSHYMRKRTDVEKYGEIISFIENCKNGEDYITRNVVELLLDDDKTKRISKELADHIVLQREFMELQMLIAKPRTVNKVISRYHEGIVHDLDYIYRLRNRLIHSAKQSEDYLEFVSMRIYRYVSAMMSTILYYKEKNPEYSIIDILNSIDATYSDYQLLITGYEKGKSNRLSIDEGYKLIRPSYLFME